MAFIVPGVCRYALNGRAAGRNVVNVLDYKIDTTGSTAARAQSCSDQAGILINEWADSILPILHSTYNFESVTFADLNSADGATGSRSVTSVRSLPLPGGGTGEALPSNAAGLVTKVTSSARGQRNGRLYLSPHGESNSIGNELRGDVRADWQSRFTAFLGDTEQSDPNLGVYTSEMVVVHIETRDPAGNPATGSSTNVSAMSVQTRLATQRRRLRG